MFASPVVQSQGLHHITLNGADKKTSIEFWEGVLGMPFIFDNQIWITLMRITCILIQATAV